jgi:putative NADH-flavin reductase
MKLLLFGATGATGKCVLHQALQEDHTVTVFVRNPLKLDIQHRNLKIVQGDVMNASSVAMALPGHDAVICCIGAPANKAGQLRSQGTKNIIQAMQQAGVQRLICMSSLGFGNSIAVLNQTSFIFKKLVVPFILKKTFQEHALQEKVIQQSGLNWTIVRAGALTNGMRTGQYKHGFSYNNTTIKVKISRQDAADFLLAQLSMGTYLKRIVGVSY